MAYIIRRFKASDSHELNACYNSFTGRSRTKRQFEWEWLTGPGGRHESWVIEDTRTGKLVGHHGVLCLPFVEEGKPCLVGKTENTFVLIEHAKKFFYPRLEKQALFAMAPSFKYIFTTASDRNRGTVGVLRKRLGYEPIGQRVTYCLRANSKTTRKLLTERFPKLKGVSQGFSFLHAFVQGLLMWVAFWKLKNISVEVRPWSSLHDVETFWQENCGHYGITADRTSTYLKWRFELNPHGRYELLSIAYEGTTIGYGVLSRTKLSYGKQIVDSTFIDDLIVKSGTERNFFIAFSALAKKINSDALLFETLHKEDPVNAAIRKLLGPLSKWQMKIGPQVLAWSRGTVPKNWYFTNLLKEGVKYNGT